MDSDVHVRLGRLQVFPALICAASFMFLALASETARATEPHGAGQGFSPETSFSVQTSSDGEGPFDPSSSGAGKELPANQRPGTREQKSRSKPGRGKHQKRKKHAEPENPADAQGRGAAAPSSDGQHAVQEAADPGQQSPFFPDWPTPDFGFSVRPILGLAWDTVRVSLERPGGGQEEISTETLSIEGGLRLGVQNIPVLPGNPGVSISPYAGYAYGKRFELSESDGVEDATYHRIMVGETTALRIKMFRYELGLHYGRIFGEPRLTPTSNQLEIVQDLGLKTTQRTSVHSTVLVGRVYAESYGAYAVQYTDVWLHLKWNPVLSVSIDLGPGRDFIWFPVTEQSASNTYARALLGWDIFGPFGVSGRLQYEIAADARDRTDDSARAGSTGEQREPLQDLGARANRLGRLEDSTSFLFFAGLRNLLFGVSFGYISRYDVLNTFERSGARKVSSTQGLGVYAGLEF